MGTDAAPALVGHAIVSADGMIAAADGSMPATLRIEADWQRFQQALDRSVLVVLGRLGHRRHPNPGRPRLVLTGRVARLAVDPEDPDAVFWNPEGCSFAAALADLGIAFGDVAVAGGTRVFSLFASQYSRFALSEVHDLVLPDGRPCFAVGHPRTVLAAAGLRPGRRQPLDANGRATLTHWERPGEQ